MTACRPGSNSGIVNRMFSPGNLNIPEVAEQKTPPVFSSRSTVEPAGSRKRPARNGTLSAHLKSRPERLFLFRNRPIAFGIGIVCGSSIRRSPTQPVSGAFQPSDAGGGPVRRNTATAPSACNFSTRVKAAPEILAIASFSVQQCQSERRAHDARMRRNFSSPAGVWLLCIPSVI